MKTYGGDAASYQPQQPENGEGDDFENSFGYVDDEKAVKAVESVWHMR